MFKKSMKKYYCKLIAIYYNFKLKINKNREN